MPVTTNYIVFLNSATAIRPQLNKMKMFMDEIQMVLKKLYSKP